MSQNSNLRIEKAQFTDMPAIADIIRSSATWYEKFVDAKDMVEHYVDHNWMKENFKKRDFFVGKDHEGNEIGTISMQFFDKQTYLGYIYLDTKHVGKGHGKRLMDFAKRRSIEKGQESMILIAHPEATWATRAYEKYGFERIMEEKEEILKYKDGVLTSYYEEGFHLYEYKLAS